MMGSKQESQKKKGEEDEWEKGEQYRIKENKSNASFPISAFVYPIKTKIVQEPHHEESKQQHSDDDETHVQSSQSPVIDQPLSSSPKYAAYLRQLRQIAHDFNTPAGSFTSKLTTMLRSRLDTAQEILFFLVCCQRK
jgi:hypothetical protein